LGYSNITATINTINSLVNDTQLDFKLLQQSAGLAVASPNTCIPGGKTKVTITQELIDAAVSTLTNYGYTEADARNEIAELQNSNSIPKVGDSIPSPAMMYSRNNSDPNLKNEFFYTTGERPTVSVPCPSADPSGRVNPRLFKKRLRFSDDRKIIVYNEKDVRSIFGTSLISTMEITFMDKSSEGQRNRSSILITQTQKKGNFSQTTEERMNLESCAPGTGSQSCVRVFQSTEVKTGTNKNFNNKVELSGRADTNGGFLVTKIFENGSTTAKIETRESFTSSGVLLGYEERDPTIPNDPWAAVSGYTLIPSDQKLSQADYGLESQIEVTIAITSSGIGKGNGYTEEDYFVITEFGKDPNSDDGAIIGEGYYIDSTDSASGYDNGSPDIVQTDEPDPDAAEVEVTYFIGEASKLSTYVVWREVYDSDGEFEKYEKVNNKVILLQ
jgi:hypothetical protein